MTISSFGHANTISSQAFAVSGLDDVADDVDGWIQPVANKDAQIFIGCRIFVTSNWCVHLETMH